VGLPPGLGGGKSGLRALRERWLNLQSAYELRRIRCERRSRETRRVNVTRPASADCASSWLQELLTLLLQLQHVLRRTQIDPFVERERGQRDARPSINCTSSTSQWPAPTLRHTIRVLNAISSSVQAFALVPCIKSTCTAASATSSSILAERCRRS